MTRIEPDRLSVTVSESLHGWLPLPNQITNEMIEAGARTLGATLLKGSHRDVARAVYEAMRAKAA